MDRRSFLRAGALAAAAGLVAGPAAATWPSVPLPRWRGFNLLEKFNHERAGPFVEDDFRMMSDWGFNFARLPMSYRCWADPAEPLRIRESAVEDIDRAVEYGRRHGVHVNLNFHRAPGYCVNPPPEPFDLWKDPHALDACAFHWSYFARRYRGLPSTQLSFDLLNEPAGVDADTYVRVVTRLTEAIRAVDPTRLVIADGLRYGRDPLPQLAALDVGQSTRGYDPMIVSHHGASWVNGQNWPKPEWPLVLPNGERWDRERLRREIIGPWRELASAGVGVHVGEWGVYNRTPHPVALAYMRDYLDLWRELGWGWALWNFRGPFGILDSGRSDVAYRPFRGRQLDRRMLDLLRAG